MRSVVSIAIPPEMRARFDSLAGTEESANRHRWTPLEDMLLLEYWPRKNHVEVARELGVCKDTALARYRELTR